MPKRMPAIGTLDEVIGRNVAAERQRLKMSQAELGQEVDGYLGLGAKRDSEVTGWPRQVVWRIEHGQRSLNASELVALALVLGVTVTHLLTAHDQPTDDHEVHLSDEWDLTVGELRETVMGRAKAAKEAEARRALMTQIIGAGTHTVTVTLPKATIQQEPAKPARKGKKR